MDAARILGVLLGNRSNSGGLGQQILEQVLGGKTQQVPQQAPQRVPQRAPQQRAPQQRAEQSARYEQDDDPFGGYLRDVHRQYRQPAQRQPAQRQPAQRQPQSTPHDHHHHADDEQSQQRAVTLIRAMVNAAKSDGAIDQAEQDKILNQLGDVSQDEIDFLRAEFRRPLDVHDFAHSVPAGMEQEVYAISLMAIDLDTRPEAQYLRELGECLRISPEISNALHQRYGAPCLYKIS